MSPEGLPPGFRFHPTDEELVSYYLKSKIQGLRIDPDIIPVVDLYKCEPWELPEKSFLPSRGRPECYLFGARNRKYPNGFRTNRATRAGYWKSTGNDRRVLHNTAAVGMKKTLVYHEGRAPQGVRTDWVMHEYSLHDDTMASIQLFSFALCRVFNKKAICTQVGVLQGLPSSGSEGCYGIPLPPEVPIADDDDYSWIDEIFSDDAGCSTAAPDVFSAEEEEST